MAFAAAGLEDIPAHFLPRHKSLDGRTWSMVCLGRDVQSRKAYLLGMDHCLFWNISIRYPRHNLGNYMILGSLLSATLRGYY